MPKNIVFKSKAYCKMILHSAKFPHYTVSGILLGNTSPSNSKNVTFEDSIPLFHIDHNLTPMAEVALAQIDEYVSKKNLSIAGYYIAQENLRENTVEMGESKIADKIASYFEHPCVVVVDNTKLGNPLENIALKVSQYNDGAYRFCEKENVSLEPANTLEVCSKLLSDQKYEILYDFDNHLDDVRLDWLNLELNKEISVLC